MHCAPDMIHGHCVIIRSQWLRAQAGEDLNGLEDLSQTPFARRQGFHAEFDGQA
jgi:hypothetical protein